MLKEKKQFFKAVIIKRAKIKGTILFLCEVLGPAVSRVSFTQLRGGGQVVKREIEKIK